MTYPLNAPLLDLLVLSIIRKEDSYGYQISQQLKCVSSMKDSTLYPILKRLSDSGYVDTYDQPFQGRNRKYYRITDDGIQQQQTLLGEWQSYTDAIYTIVHEQSKHTKGESKDDEN